MAKTSGGTRGIGGPIEDTELKRNDKSKDVTYSEYVTSLASGGYVEKHSYYSDKTGACVLFMRKHNYKIEEDEVARALADNGFMVVMTPEGVEMYATRKVTKDGKVKLKYSEGTISKLTYEQSTITDVNVKRERTTAKAIEHAKEKGADISVIYDRKGLLHRKDIQNGIKEYESHVTNLYRAKVIIVVDKDKKLHFWKHDT